MIQNHQTWSHSKVRTYQICFNNHIKLVENFSGHPRGYRQRSQFSVAWITANIACAHRVSLSCIQTSCEGLVALILQKRHRLYRMFWRLLSDLRVWVDDEYLERKEHRTVIQDRREITPKCVITNLYNEMFKLALANASRHVCIRRGSLLLVSNVHIITKVFCTSCQ